MTEIVIRNADELYATDADSIDWTLDPTFKFATEVDALQTLEFLGHELKAAREQARQIMRYIQAAVDASQATTEDGKVAPQAIINHSGLARQTVYNMLPPALGDTYTLISAAPGDRMPGSAVELAESTLDWNDLPEEAQAWADGQGYGDESELLYVVPGKVILSGWPTFTVSPDALSTDGE